MSATGLATKLPQCQLSADTAKPFSPDGGYDLSGMTDGVSTPAACCALCVANSACQVWTLDQSQRWTSGGRCHLKTSSAGRRYLSAHVSGARPINNPPTSWPTSTQPTIRPTTAPPTHAPTGNPTPHVCNTQLHPCDLSTTICQATPRYPAGFQCVCREGYIPRGTSQTQCILTPPPSFAPTRIPTVLPTGNPTGTPTSFPTTSQPTVAPSTMQPTSTPTRHPTPRACDTQVHGCDMLTTYCQRALGGGAAYECMCRTGYVPTPLSDRRCDASLAPSLAPTNATAAGSSGGESSTVTYSVVGVVVVVLVGVVVLVIVRKKASQSNTRSKATQSSSGNKHNSFGFDNPNYDNTNSAYEASYVDVAPQ